MEQVGYQAYVFTQKMRGIIANVQARKQITSNKKCIELQDACQFVSLDLGKANKRFQARALIYLCIGGLHEIALGRYCRIELDAYEFRPVGFSRLPNMEIIAVNVDR